MRRSSVPLLVFALVMGASVATDGRIGAQDATPPAGSSHPHAVGVTLADLGNGIPTGAPGLGLHLVRVVQEPGGHIDPHRHPGAQVFYVDQGTVGFSVYRGSAWLVRATDSPGTQGTLVPEGTEIILDSGDWLYFEQDVVESARNAGDNPAVILIAALYYAGFPTTIFEEGVTSVANPAVCASTNPSFKPPGPPCSD